jgi:hypothetical protein
MFVTNSLLALGSHDHARAAIGEGFCPNGHGPLELPLGWCALCSAWWWLDGDEVAYARTYNVRGGSDRDVDMEIPTDGIVGPSAG